MIHITDLRVNVDLSSIGPGIFSWGSTAYLE
jgi:hypothetical protein